MERWRARFLRVQSRILAIFSNVRLQIRNLRSQSATRLTTGFEARAEKQKTTGLLLARGSRFSQILMRRDMNRCIVVVVELESFLQLSRCFHLHNLSQAIHPSFERDHRKVCILNARWIALLLMVGKRGMAEFTVSTISMRFYWSISLR